MCVVVVVVVVVVWGESWGRLLLLLFLEGLPAKHIKGFFFKSKNLVTKQNTQIFVFVTINIFCLMSP